MPLYQDGTEVRIGDTFWSTRSSPEWLWKIINLDGQKVYWKGISFAHNGSNPLSDTQHWVLVSREGQLVSRKTSGFSKFIRRIENDDK